uniref:Uncharacterized protein n=1 Tax=Oryza barthii TaxID=65489 RepID=A0A0D3HL27_9ORYZ
MPGAQDTGWYLGIRPWYQGIKHDTCGVSEGNVKKRGRHGRGSAATAEDGVEEARRGEGRISNLGTKVSSLILVGYRRVLSKGGGDVGEGGPQRRRMASRRHGEVRARPEPESARSLEEEPRRSLMAIPVAGRRGLPASIPEA